MAESDAKEGQFHRVAFMTKRSIGKTMWKVENYRGRWFVLKSKVLLYYNGTEETGVKDEKGRIYLAQVRAVEPVQDEALNRQNTFQVVYMDHNLEEELTLYIIARSETERAEWLKVIRDACIPEHANLLPMYHPGIWNRKSKMYTCCELRDQNAQGCKPAFNQPADEEFINNNPSHVPPDSPKPVKKKVKAKYDYVAIQPGDMTILRGEEYTIIDDGNKNWWKVINQTTGVEGYIPANYVSQIQEGSLQSYGWFKGDITRAQAEAQLRATKKKKVPTATLR